MRSANALGPQDRNGNSMAMGSAVMGGVSMIGQHGVNMASTSEDSKWRTRSNSKFRVTTRNGIVTRVQDVG